LVLLTTFCKMDFDAKNAHNIYTYINLILSFELWKNNDNNDAELTRSSPPFAFYPYNENEMSKYYF